jgi:hypothetical protein
VEVTHPDVGQVSGSGTGTETECGEAHPAIRITMSRERNNFVFRIMVVS